MEGKLAPSHCSKWKKARAAVRRRNIYYCGNDTSTQFFTASVAEELLLNTELTEESKDRAIHLLKEFGLYEYRDAHPSTLSGGQKQRVAIARALMRHPAILLADEPVASLDPVTGRQILELLKSIHETDGVTILMNSHNLEFSQEFSDRLIGLKDGKVVFDGKTADLTDSITTQIYNKNDTQIENKRGIAYE